MKIGDDVWGTIVAEVSESIATRLAEANENTKAFKLGRALTLEGLLESRSSAGQTLEQVDQQAYDVLFPRKQAIEQRRTHYLQDHATAELIRRARERGVRKWAAQIDSHARYLMSDDFQNELSGHSDARRNDVYQQQLIWLGSVDPQKAAEVASSWAADYMMQYPLAAIMADGIEPAALSASFNKVVVLLAKSSATIEGLSKVLNTVQAQPTAGAELAAALKASGVPRLATGPSGAAAMGRGVNGLLDSLPGASLVKHIHNHTASYGRGITTFFVIWSLFLIDDLAADERTTKSDLFNVAMATRFLGAAPNVAKFLVEDIKRLHPFFRWTMTNSLGPKLGGGLSSGGKSVLEAISGVGKFGKVFFGIFGVVSNGIMLGISVYGAYVEVAHNEDAAGFVASVLSSISFGAGTGSGLLALGVAISGVGTVAVAALAAVSAFAMVLSVAVNWMWGESNLTGAIRRDLRRLDITTEEEDLWIESNINKDATHARDALVDRDEVETRILNASPYERQAQLNNILDGYTPGANETMVANVLMEVSLSEFLPLIESLGPRRVASELDNPQQAARVMARTATAYEERNQAPGTAFNAQLLSHAYEHNAATIIAFLELISAELYGRIEPGIVIEATELLMNEHTNTAEQTAVAKLLLNCSVAQFDTVATRGGHRYLLRVKGEVSVDEWRTIHAKLSRGGREARFHARNIPAGPRYEGPAAPRPIYGDSGPGPQ